MQLNKETKPNLICKDNGIYTGGLKGCHFMRDIVHRRLRWSKGKNMCCVFGPYVYYGKIKRVGWCPRGVMVKAAES